MPDQDVAEFLSNRINCLEVRFETRFDRLETRLDRWMAKNGDQNDGMINAVFVDAHVEEVRSALKEDKSDNSEKEFGKFEKYGWPFKESPTGL